MSTLFLVGTPIGNLEDISLRALRILREVGLIAAEDTRVTRKLLSHYDIHTPLLSYQEHNAHRQTPKILCALTSSNVALTCDAGMPGTSDPGACLVDSVIGEGHNVVPIPGPSSLTVAIAVCSFKIDGFLFLGFLPRNHGKRKSLLSNISHMNWPIVIMEAPHRFRQTLTDILDILGDRQMTTCRELSKIHEEIFHGLVSEGLSYFTNPKGEIILVLQGQNSPDPIMNEIDLRHLFDEIMARELTGRDTVFELVENAGFSRREAYRLWLKIKNGETI